MSLQTVAPLDELPEGEGFLFRHESHQIALFRQGETVSAIDNVCPHAGASLADGYVDGDSVACPWHCWEFSVVTGKCSTISNSDVDTYAVVVDEGIVKVEIPE